LPIAWIPHPMREMTGGTEKVAVNGANVREVIQALESLYPNLVGLLIKNDQLGKGIAVAVDGRIVRRGLYEPLQSDSEIHFIPALGAG
jgi:molybdopterin synthase sulfur carrier subunit